MTLKIVTVGKLEVEKAKAIELYDEDPYNFFRKTGGDNYSVYVDSSLFSKDAKQQRAFVLFAENFQEEIAGLSPAPRLAHEASTKVGSVLTDLKQDIVQFEIPIRQGRFAELDGFDSKDYELFEDAGRVTLDGESLVLARIRFDLSHYFNIAEYRKAVDVFMGNVRTVYDQALAQGNRTLEELDPDLANFIRFCSFPDIHFDLAMSEQRFSEISGQFDPSGHFLKRQGTMTLPNDAAMYVRAKLVIHTSDLKSDPAKRAQLQAFAIAVLGYYDRKLAERGQQVGDLDVDMRNFYRILYAYKSFPSQGDLTGAALVSDAANQAAIDAAFEGVTVGTPASEFGSSLAHRPAAAGEAASATVTVPSTSGDVRADQRPAPPAPPREKTPEEKVVDALKDKYAVGKKTRGGLEIVGNTSSVFGGSVTIGIVAKRSNGQIAEIVPVPPRQLTLGDSMFESLVQNAAAQKVRGVMASVADWAARRSNKKGWEIRLVATITTYRDGRVTVKVRKESGKIPDDPGTEQGAIEGAKNALAGIAWPIDDRTGSQTFEVPVVIVPPSD